MAAGTGYLWTSAGGKTMLSGMSFANAIDSQRHVHRGCDSTAAANCAVYNTSTHAVTIVDHGALPMAISEALGGQQQRRGSRREPASMTRFVYIPGTGRVHLANAIASGGTTGADYVQAVSINMPDRSSSRGSSARPSDEHTWLFTPVATPEPLTLLLAASRTTGLLAYAWRKRK